MKSTSLGIMMLALTLLLTACVTDQEVCANFGFTPGTDAFANCVQNRYAERRAALQTWAAQQQAQQQSWYHEQMESIRANAPRYQPIQPIQPIQRSTDCYRVGDVVHCSSY